MDIKKIGKFIAVNRKAKGLTQEQLGEMLGVSNKTVSRWENGNYMPDLSLLEPLSSALGITLNELLAGEFIPQEDMAARTERNLVDTIGYTAGKLKHEQPKNLPVNNERRNLDHTLCFHMLQSREQLDRRLFYYRCFSFDFRITEHIEFKNLSEKTDAGNRPLRVPPCCIFCNRLCRRDHL